MKTNQLLKMPRLLYAVLGLMLLISLAAAEGGWRTLTQTDSVGEEKPVEGCGYTGDITITFLGDCTLGGVEENRSKARGFLRTVEREGTAYPFRALSALTLHDDLTVANLEGVLSDRRLSRVEKKFNFMGPTSCTDILTGAGVDCVNLANNHSGDYGSAGYSDTKAALTDAGICWFGTDAPALWQGPDGLRIGFLGVAGSLSGNRAQRFAAQAEQLKTAGCQAIITVMHAGTEYSTTPPDSYQRQIVSRAIECGSCLIIGHHPHVVQGYDLVEDIPVVYSLGNCVFGGTIGIRDPDALVVQAALSFEWGELTGIQLIFCPIAFSGNPKTNDYSPVFLHGSDAERVLQKMRDSTGQDPGPADEQGRATVSVFVY